MLYQCHRYENTSKESQEHIFDNIASVRPLPADPGHESDWQNQENHQKIAKKKNAIFQKSVFCYNSIYVHPKGGPTLVQPKFW